MIMIEFTTENGNMIIVDVVGQKLKSISAAGELIDWIKYKEIHKGTVGEPLVIDYGDGGALYTTTTIKRLAFPETA